MSANISLKRRFENLLYDWRAFGRDGNPKVMIAFVTGDQDLAEVKQIHTDHIVIPVNMSHPDFPGTSLLAVPFTAMISVVFPNVGNVEHEDD